MKRDFELVKTILEFAEEHCDGGLKTVAVEGRDAGDIDDHVRILLDAGFVVAEITRNIGGKVGCDRWQVNRLTWAGHEYLDRLRSSATGQKSRRQVTVQSA